MDELNYLAFVLGYDLLTKFFNSCEDAPCDLVYRACRLIAKMFLEHDKEYMQDCSQYEALQNWLKDNEYKVVYAAYMCGINWRTNNGH